MQQTGNLDKVADILRKLLKAYNKTKNKKYINDMLGIFDSSPGILKYKPIA